ncbi:DUF3943 domain-containing protein [Persicimonas caeni]|uniref:DUF3943 domain-containing protein n=1 Tax=Persicimonas caeni TaxID=2292766 RepID=UPI00143D5856|nr:DUF3943 domain-containing protein [Persicimonas caeni]
MYHVVMVCLALTALLWAPSAYGANPPSEWPTPPEGSDRLTECRAISAAGAATLTEITLPVCQVATLEVEREPPLKGEMYLSTDGRWINFEDEYDVFLGRDPNRNFGRMIVEVMTELLLGGVWYIAQKDFNQQDWFFEISLDGVERKFSTTELIRFDDNTFLFNQMWHPLAGMGYYIFARTNDFGVAPSYMIGLMSSTLWEYVLELPEQVSINDQITTSVAGMALGEVGYHLGEYFNSPYSAGELDQRILTGIFGAPRWVHNYYDRKDGELIPTPNERVYWPDFRLFAGAVSRGESPTVSGNVDANFGLSTELVAMPGYRRPGQFDHYFGEGNFTRLDLEMSVGDDGVTEMALFAQAILFGFYKQDIQVEEGERRGYSLAIGGATAYQVENFDAPLLEDQRGLVHILGPALDFTMFAGDLEARFELAGYGDFVAIRSQAFPEFAARFGTEGLRSDLSNKGYYFGYGATIRPRLQFYWGRLGLGGEFQWGRYWGITGRDRRQEQVTDILDLDDHLARLQLWLDVPTPVDVLDVRLTYDTNSRLSSVDQFEEWNGYQELGARVQYLF